MTGIRVPNIGPDNADILIVGEAPGKNEEEQRTPFIGAAGVEMTRMLQQAGILRADCHITNVCKYRPPGNKIERWFFNKTQAKSNQHIFMLGKAVDPRIAEGVSELEALIHQLQPKVIIAFGNTPLWALTGEYGITKWRGSSLSTREINGQTFPLIPTYHPAAVLRRWDWRYITVHDLRKVKHVRDHGLSYPREEFIIRPSLDDTHSWLHNYLSVAETQHSRSSPLDVAVDIETRFGHITCVGLSCVVGESICIPFLEIKSDDNNYWKTGDEENSVVLALRRLLTHPHVRIIGQNFAYDQQYFAARMFFIPNYSPGLFHDTMTAHHVMFAGLPKGLDFLSSFYCWEDHVYWKDEGKEWNPKTHDEEQHWIYNAKDATRTLAVAQAQRAAYAALDFPSTDYGDPWSIQHRSHVSVLDAMLRGVRVDLQRKNEIQIELGKTITRLEDYIARLLGHPLNPRSPKQLQTLFYTDFAVKPVTTYDRATGRRRRTCGASALDTIAQREILLAPICTTINDIRSIGTFKSVAAKSLDDDDRIRCQYAVAGTETYRFSSSTDAFGHGTNLQNISSGDERYDPEDTHYRPNMRKMMVPDSGMAISDHDLEQADARIVAWEADCPSLKEIFHDPSRDLHIENTEIIFGKCTGKSDPNRAKAKAGVHATNYGATPHVLAAALGITVREAEQFINRYFGERPEVKQWHERVRQELQTRRYVENIFGFRRFYFDRIEDLLKEALAWIPQSTVAIATNLGIEQVRQRLPWTDFLMQVHDSAVHQYPVGPFKIYTEYHENAPPDIKTYTTEEAFEAIRQAMEVPLPYDDPVTIPVAGSWSEISWGHCK